MADSKSKSTSTRAEGPIEVSPEEFIDKLRRALARDGDFPASAKVVNELLKRASERNVTAGQISNIILKEQSLSARILHVVNSSFYNRGAPIMTVSSAVVRLGLKTVVELCSGLVLLQKFLPAARSEGPFADCLRQAICTSLLARSLEAEIARMENRQASETGYLAGCFAGLGMLLTGYYFPALYKSAVSRRPEFGNRLDSSIAKLTGFTPFELSIQLIRALDLPKTYEDILTCTQDSGTKEKQAQPDPQLASVVNCAHQISEILVYGKGLEELTRLLAELCPRYKIERSSFETILKTLPKDYSDHCASLEISPASLPDWVLDFVSPPAEGASETHSQAPESEDEEFLAYRNEISEAIRHGEPAVSIMLTAMETLAWGLKFDRVLLLLQGMGKRKLNGAMFLGATENFDPTRITRALELPPSPANPDVTAFKSGQIIYKGQALLPGSRCFAFIPVGYGDRAIGIIYADRTRSDAALISMQEQARLNTLADLLDYSVIARGDMLEALILASNNMRSRRSES